MSWHAIAQKMKWVWVEAAIIAVLPCLWLFNCHSGFNIDWDNQAWMAGYNGVYFHEHWAFPPVFNTNQLIGTSYPIFYGYGLFNILGLLCVIFHPYVSVLIVAYALYMVQHGSITLLLARMHMPRWFAFITALIMTFAVYPLTNLYNRSALTEFFATVSFNIGIIAFFLSMLSPHSQQRRCWYVITLMAFGLMVVSHPLTLLNAGIFMAFLCPLWLWLAPDGMRRPMVLSMCGIVLVLLLLLSPWLYALYSVQGLLAVSMEGFFELYANDIDWIVTRLSPIPFDLRVWDRPLNGISSPYLDAQVNSFLLGMAMIAVVAYVRQYGVSKAYGVFISVMAALFLFYLWCSVSLYPWFHLLPKALLIMQLPYRLVTMINLCALCMLLVTCFTLKTRKQTLHLPRRAKKIAMVLSMLALCAFIQKMMHADAIRRTVSNPLFSNSAYANEALNVPYSFWAIYAYNTPTFFDTVTNPPVTQIHLTALLTPFGEVQPTHMHANTEGWYETNVDGFKWNNVVVDGKKVVSRITTHGNHPLLNVYLLPGDHELAYAFTPPLLWSILHDVYELTALALLLMYWRSTRAPMRVKTS